MITFSKTKDTAIIPDYAEHEGDAGIDLAIPETVVLLPFVFSRIDLGLIWHAPPRHPDLPSLVPMLKIEPRSSTPTKHGIMISPGVVDSGYDGELCFSAVNLNPHTIQLERGTQLVQGVLHLVGEAPNKGKQRYDRGFGSTGDS